MSSKAKNQKSSVYEQSLAKLGDRQVSFAKEFDPATDYIVHAAQRDESGTLRSRANTDAALAFGGDKGATFSAATGSTRGLSDQTIIENDARGSALGAASSRAMKIRDESIGRAGRLLLGSTESTSRGLRDVAQNEFDLLAEKAKLANERRNSNLALGTAALTTGAMVYAGGSPSVRSSSTDSLGVSRNIDSTRFGEIRRTA